MVQHRKKTLKTGLTASRRKARRPAMFDRHAALDEMSVRCRRAIALAELLEACGRCAGAEPLEASVVTGAGELILVEIRAMRALLKTFWREEAQ